MLWRCYDSTMLWITDNVIATASSGAEALFGVVFSVTCMNKRWVLQ
jgi:hypothetical protein